MAKKRTRMYQGLPVIDAPDRSELEFTVTPEIARKSKSNDPAHCAAAVAASEEYHTEVHVHLSRTYVLDEKKDRWIRYITPTSIQREIVSFDRSHHFEPGNYYIRAAGPMNKLGTYKPTGPKQKKGNGKKKPLHVTAKVRNRANEYWK